MSSKAFIILRCPELASHTDVDDFILLADAQTSLTAFGNKDIGAIGTSREYAVALRAMHLMAKQEMGNSGGVVQSEKEGDLQRSYYVADTLSKKYPDLVCTVWGKELAELIEANIVPIITSRM